MMLACTRTIQSSRFNSKYIYLKGASRISRYRSSHGGHLYYSLKDGETPKSRMRYGSLY